MNEKTKKTTRKNKTNQTINWPSPDNYFTMDTLIESNQHMLTSGKSSDITLRVRLMKEVKGENQPKTVAVMATINNGKGRPQLVFSMIPVKQEVLDKAVSDKIILESQTNLIPVMEVRPTTPTTTPIITPVKIVEKQTVAV